MPRLIPRQLRKNNAELGFSDQAMVLGKKLSLSVLFPVN
jgi:hypothetical protein